MPRPSGSSRPVGPAGADRLLAERRDVFMDCAESQPGDDRHFHAVISGKNWRKPSPRRNWDLDAAGPLRGHSASSNSLADARLYTACRDTTRFRRPSAQNCLHPRGISLGESCETRNHACLVRTNPAVRKSASFRAREQKNIIYNKNLIIKQSIKCSNILTSDQFFQFPVVFWGLERTFIV